MGGTTYERIPHDDPNCVSSNPAKALQVFYNEDETFSGFCFSCKKKVENPYGDNPPSKGSVVIKSPQQIAEEIADVRSCPFLDHEYRAITPDQWKHFGVRSVTSPYTGDEKWAIAHPYTLAGKLVGFKIKLRGEKKMWNIGNVRGADLYAWERARKTGARALYITEGEEDAIALRQIMKTANLGTKYESLDYAVVSLPAGSTSVSKTLGRMAGAILETFESIVLVFDDDEPGKLATTEARKIFPDATVARLPEKDANECLVQGRISATKAAVAYRSSKPKESLTLNADDIMDQILGEPQWGKSVPWPTINKLLYGQRKGELISIGAGTGVGKTLIAHELIASNAMQHDWKTLSVMMEETPAKTYKSVAGKLDNKPYHVPLKPGDPNWDLDQLKSTIQKVNPYMSVWDIAKIEDTETTWEQIKHEIRTQGNDLDVVIIDNATKLTESLSTSETNEFMGRFADEYTRLAIQFDFVAVILSHLNTPPKGSRDHENGGVVRESQFTGSRALQRYSHIMMGMERNKGAVDPNCSVIRVMKNREYGLSGYVKTYYDRDTGRLQEFNWSDDSYKDKKVAGGE